MHREVGRGASAVWRRVIWVLERKRRVCAACGLFGLAYGAACGAYLGLLVGTPIAAAILRGIIAGAWFGWCGGLIGGGAGSFLRASWRWCLAGVVGGLTTLPVFWWIGLYAARHASRPVDLSMNWRLALFVAGAAVVGGALGRAVDRAARGDEPSLPGIGTLLRVFAEDVPPPEPPPSARVPAEVTPATAPSGRGDEAAPAVGE
jgi:hypothetical protein